MKLVLDSSVAIKWVLPEPDAGEARKLRQDFRQGTHDLISPDVFLAEVAHVLTKGERRGFIPQGEAAVLLADILTTPPELQVTLPLLPRAVELASRYRVAFYDCLYVTLAEMTQSLLITSDKKLIGTFRGEFPHVVDLTDFA